MLYLGTFYADDGDREATFQLMVEADSIEDATRSFKKKLRTSKIEALDDIENIYVYSIIEIKSLTKTPILINFKSKSQPPDFINSSIGCDIPDHVRGAVLDSYSIVEDDHKDNNVPIFVTRSKKEKE